jgi:hypothetical protein
MEKEIKKQKELVGALLKIRKLSQCYGVRIDSISVAPFWFSDVFESLYCPNELLGIKISNSYDNIMKTIDNKKQK